jgi:hypothetical protein
MSVRPNWKTRLLLDRFSWNSTFVDFPVEKIQVSLKIWQIMTATLHEHQWTIDNTSLSSSHNEKYSTQRCRENQNKLLCLKAFSQKSCFYVEVYLYSLFNLGARWRWICNPTPRPLYPRERPSTHCIEGWAGPRAGLDGCGKSRRHRDPIPGPSNTQQVALPTQLSRPS